MKKLYITIALLAALALTTAFAQKEVVIGWSGAVTGPTSDAGKYVVQGIEDYCQYANDENLVPGYTIKCLTRDDEYNNDNTLRNFESYLDDDMVAFIGYATGGSLQLKVNTTEEEVPLMGSSLHIGLIDSPDNNYMFLPITSYSEQVLSLFEWIAENHEGGGTPKVAMFVHASPFGRAPVEDARLAAEILGVEIVEVQEATKGLDYTAMLQRWDNAGVQYMIGQHVQSPIATILNSAKDLDLLGKIKFMGAHYTGGTSLITLAGDAAENFIWSTSFYLPDEDKPGIALQKEIGERYGRSADAVEETNYTTGLLQASIYVEAARLAALNGDVTKESLYQALLTMNGDNEFDPGFSVGPVSFSEDDHIGVDALRLLQVQDGKFVAITEAFNSATFPQVHPPR